MSILELKNIHKSFGKTKVLKGIDLTLEKGQVLSIIGSSGSGKTTLLRCINLLEIADEGEFLVNGEVIFRAGEKISAKEMQQKQLHFGLVFQDFNLFPQYTVLDNVMLAPKLHAKEEYKKDRKKRKEIFDKIREEAIEILDRVGLKDKIDSYPCELSGGQKQRVSIARALALKPSILFFDEPTSALDPELTGEILKVIRKLASEKTTMVIVTHEIDFAEAVSDKIIFMDDGLIEEEGTPDEVLKSPKSERTRAFLTKLSDQ